MRKIYFKLAACAFSLAAATQGKTASALPTNKSLAIGTSQEFESLNPILSSMQASVYLSYLANRPLAAINKKWTWECFECVALPSFENGLAQWVEDKGEKKLKVFWQIKPGRKWGDGTPITAKDYALRVEIGKSANVEVPSRDIYNNIEKFELDAKDPLKFMITHKEARYDYYQMPIEPLPSHIEGPIWNRVKSQTGAYEKQTAYTTDPSNPGLYSGPYVVGELKLGSHIIFKKNPHFGGDPAKVEKLIFKLIANTQSLEATLISGEIDMIGEIGFSFDQALEFEKRIARDPALKSRFQTLFRQGLTYEHVDMNLRNPILADRKVRLALIYGADRAKLVQALFGGKQPVAHSSVHPLDPYYFDQVPKYEYDLAKARQLLDEAGWKPGSDGIRMKDGQRLELTIMTTAGNKSRELVETFLQAEWKKLGIAVPIKNEPARVFFSETTKKAAFPALAMYAWSSSPDNPPRTTLHSREIPTKENAYSGQNYPGWANAQVDSLLDRIMGEFDLEKRKVMMTELQKIYVEDLPVIPLYFRSEIAVAPSNLTGYELVGHQFYSSLYAENWNLEAKSSTH